MTTETKFKETEIGMIPEDWDVESSSEYCESVRDGTHDSPKKIEIGKYLITSRHLQGHNLDFENAYFISDKDFDDVNKRSKVDQWDVLISMIGTIGETYLERNEPDYAIKNVGLFKNKDELKGKWLYYWLSSPQSKEFITSQRSGTTQEYITLGSLRQFPVAVPRNKTEMKKLVDFLESISLKIELLQQQNKTLENIGKTIFKQWFIDFEFPNEEGKPYKSSGGEMIESELGKIPKGWKFGKLGDFVESISGCSYTSRGLKESEKALVTLKSISVTGFSQDGFKEYVGDYKEKHIVKDGDIVVAHTDLTQNRIILGKPAVVRDLGTYKEMIASMDLSIVKPVKLLNRPYIFYLLHTQNFHNYAQGYANGTTVIHLSRKAIPEFDFSIPSEAILKKFENISNKIFDKISICQKEILMLQKTRDSLLPKLMTGKIRVPYEN